MVKLKTRDSIQFKDRTMEEGSWNMNQQTTIMWNKIS